MKDKFLLSHIVIKAPNQELALELHSRAEPSVEAHNRSVGPVQEEIPEEGR